MHKNTRSLWNDRSATETTSTTNKNSFYITLYCSCMCVFGDIWVVCYFEHTNRAGMCSFLFFKQFSLLSWSEANIMSKHKDRLTNEAESNVLLLYTDSSTSNWTDDDGEWTRQQDSEKKNVACKQGKCCFVEIPWLCFMLTCSMACCCCYAHAKRLLLLPLSRAHTLILPNENQQNTCGS